MKKTCTKCLRELDIACFHKAGKSKRTGKQFYQSNCKDCTSINMQDYYLNNAEEIKTKKRPLSKKWREQNPDKYKEQMKKYAKENSENLKAYKKKWYEENKERLVIEHQHYRETHKEEKKLRNKRYRENNRDKIREQKYFHVLKRRSKKANVECNFDKYDWQRCTDHFDNSCAYCGSKGKLTQDHFIALKHGGSYTRDNIVPACSRCNESKNARNVFVWYPKQKFCTQERFDKITDYLGFDPKARNTQLKLVI